MNVVWKRSGTKAHILYETVYVKLRPSKTKLWCQYVREELTLKNWSNGWVTYKRLWGCWSVPYLDLGDKGISAHFIIKFWDVCLFCALYMYFTVKKSFKMKRQYLFCFCFKEKSWPSRMVILKAVYYRKVSKFLFISCSTASLFIYLPLDQHSLKNIIASTQEPLSMSH